ncbi:hypothetical protein OIU79_014275 [Salix purpurea]|uniref:Uncharacterized protein n=1 Tax=Salix purpurea TaxID=77065 RepID=A0A9Q0SWY3_SALPP|nr:hypothetical protein OIU79_014275 [Salix purpurea]
MKRAKALDRRGTAEVEGSKEHEPYMGEIGHEADTRIKRSDDCWESGVNKRLEIESPAALGWLHDQLIVWFFSLKNLNFGSYSSSAQSSLLAQPSGS